MSPGIKRVKSLQDKKVRSANVFRLILLVTRLDVTVYVVRSNVFVSCHDDLQRGSAPSDSAAFRWTRLDTRTRLAEVGLKTGGHSKLTRIRTFLTHRVSFMLSSSYRHTSRTHRTQRDTDRTRLDFTKGFIPIPRIIHMHPDSLKEKWAKSPVFHRVGVVGLSALDIWFAVTTVQIEWPTLLNPDVNKLSQRSCWK